MLNSSHHFWIRCSVYVSVHCFYCIFFWVHLSIVCHFTALLWKQSPLEHYGITVMYLKLSLKVSPLDYISLIILFRFWHYMCDTFAGWSCFSSMTETSLYLPDGIWWNYFQLFFQVPKSSKLTYFWFKFSFSQGCLNWPFFKDWIILLACKEVTDLQGRWSLSNFAENFLWVS